MSRVGDVVGVGGKPYVIHSIEQFRRVGRAGSDSRFPSEPKLAFQTLMHQRFLTLPELDTYVKGDMITISGTKVETWPNEETPNRECSVSLYLNFKVQKGEFYGE